MKCFASAIITTSILAISFCFSAEEITSTEFSSGGFRITKVMSTPKRLNALGKMAQFGDSNDVGKYTELNKDLPAEEQGEEFIINWQYAGKAQLPSVVLRLEYITGKKTEIFKYEKAYAAVKPARFQLTLKNIGSAYKSNGEIAHWKVSIISGNTLLASRESRMWRAFQTYSNAAKDKN